MRKLSDLQVLATDVDLAIRTETWLKPSIKDCEVSSTDFTIFREDRLSRPAVMLAIRDNITYFRRPELEGAGVEVMFCEMRPDSKRKHLVQWCFLSTG